MDPYPYFSLKLIFGGFIKVQQKCEAQIINIKCSYKRSEVVSDICSFLLMLPYTYVYNKKEYIGLYDKRDTVNLHNINFLWGDIYSYISYKVPTFPSKARG